MKTMVKMMVIKMMVVMILFFLLYGCREDLSSTQGYFWALYVEEKVEEIGQAMLRWPWKRCGKELEENWKGKARWSKRIDIEMAVGQRQLSVEIDIFHKGDQAWLLLELCEANQCRSYRYGKEGEKWYRSSDAAAMLEVDEEVRFLVKRDFEALSEPLNEFWDGEFKSIVSVESVGEEIRCEIEGDVSKGERGMILWHRGEREVEWHFSEQGWWKVHEQWKEEVDAHFPSIAEVPDWVHERDMARMKQLKAIFR